MLTNDPIDDPIKVKTWPWLISENSNNKRNIESVKDQRTLAKFSDQKT